MEKTRLTEERICSTLQTQLYSMANKNNDSKYEPLQLKWVLPVSSTQGLMSVLKNIVYILGYVQKNKCNEDTIDKIIENDIRLMVQELGNEFDFFVAGTIMAMCDTVDDFSDADELMGLAQEIIGKFICILETAAKQFDPKSDNQSADEAIFRIDTSKLELGMVVKNYREMCKILGEEVCGGDSKKAQLKEWARYFLWEKKGQKFIILDIYDEPLPKEDGRTNKNIYVQYIGVILTKILSKQKNSKEPFYITTNQMWKLLGMINNNYKNISLDELNDRIPEYDVKLLFRILFTSKFIVLPSNSIKPWYQTN